MARSLSPSSVVLQSARATGLKLMSNLIYIILLISFTLNGYMFARLQASGQSLFSTNSAIAGTTAPNQQIPMEQTGQPTAARDNIEVDKGSLPVLGNANAKVKIIEFSDFQCPFCRTFFTQAYKQLKSEYIDTGKVALYYRHFPLDFHPSAFASAEASECANDQGKFWEMHDKLYEEQEKQGSGTTIQYTKDDLKAWAADLGLNSGTFNECLDSEKHKEKVQKDMTDGAAAGVSGTPTFFVNGKELVGAQPFTAFKAAIDEKLNQ